jgi:hypothetical protein
MKVASSTCSLLCSLRFSFLIEVRVINWQHNFDGARSSSNFAPVSSRSNASMKNLFESGPRELMTYVTMGNVELVIRELI